MRQFRNHILTLRKFSNHIVINHDFQAVAVDAEDTDDSLRVDFLFFGYLFHEIADCPFGQVECTVVIVLLVLVLVEADVEAGNLDMLV